MRKYNEISRRGFLRSAVLAGTGICASSVFNGMVACEGVNRQGPSALDCKTNAVVGVKRTLGSGTASMVVSAMGFGCMGLNHHRGQHPGKKQVIALVHEAIDRGVTLFDTAESYGYQTNERLVGEALKGYSDRVFVTTKFGHKFVDGVQIKTEEDSSPNNIRKVCENSLRNLGVETLGMFYQHRADPNTPIEVVAETVNELIREGKVLHFGLCEVNADTIRRAHRICPVTAIQSEYHLMHRAVEESVLPLCEELGIGFVPYSPINRGFLGGLINEYTRFDPENDNRQDLPRFQPEAIRANMRIVEVLKQNRSAPVPVEKQVAILYATIHDLLVKVKVADVAEYEKGLYEYLENDAAGAAVMETIRTTGNLDKDTEEALKGVLSAYTESFVKAH